MTGTTAGNADFTERTVQRLPWLIAAVVLLSLLLLTAAFRSLAIGIKAAVMNLLSVGAAYGVVVAVFQWGWGSSLFGLDEKVPIPAFVPMLMFAIVFGLSMDYEVFLLSRVHEAYAKTGDAHRSVAIGIGGTAAGHHHGRRRDDRRVHQLRRDSRSDHQDAGRRHGGVGTDRRESGPDGPRAGDDVAARRERVVGTRWLDRILPHIDIEGEDEDAELPEPEPAAS